MTFLELWYWCWITEFEEREEPDWSRVPEDRRERVRAAWDASRLVRRRFKLWGPQIPWFQKFYTVEVDGLA